MLIRLRQSGGIAYIPGLQRPIEVDTAALPDDEAAELEALVRQAEQQLSDTPSDPRGADQRTYHLEVEDAHGARSLTAHDPVASDAFADLVTRLHDLI